ncbi:hypothetical protein EAY39_07860 [Vibrio anguillarum]|uniref:hypothetical protein n=1 Tax=Vibrio anguillarum TaxID=55601 RepID=UPI00188BE209|nr:hypothetical protein [Vibrio anguillarum]MBF4340702.1 hypothetical protein [Vibrio anguillarum]MBF4370884.1 hypothetical protein [Vibrio anguillarum]
MKKLINYAAFLWFAWFMICLIVVGKTELTNRTMDSANALQKYKEECVIVGGKVRHKTSFLASNVYCQEADGNESVFFYHSPFSVVGLSLDLVQQLTFGLFDISEMKSENT